MKKRMTYCNYVKHIVTKMRPWVEGDDMSKIYISTSIIPEIGGMISNRDGKDFEYITPEFFNEHYKEYDND